ncbi:restriction endonuclease subunit S [Shewanella frigidimarina]|uniref:restriction endonuclease subunit S n=1 Tax=Shewanella frigidimarina TaxID=56812 RepID=UPI000F4DE926|nr:restriction endonuclease subunit S [Shewanella frigidimarina]RPA27852.1 type I restriction endonuclease subunit S [Shewanella frigidimarina]
MSQVIPEGWALAKLDELISYEGVIADGDWVESKDQDPEGSIRLIQLADIGDGEFLNKSNRFMNVASAQRLNCTLLKENDVLIARMPDPLGRACLFPKIENEAVTVVDVCLIRLDDRAGISPKVLMHWINSSVIRNIIALEATGTTRKRITRKKLSHFDFPLPPLAEQKVIADKLDELLAQVERTKARLDAIPAILKSFRQSLLAAAVSGKLTEEWRGVNPEILLDGPVTFNNKKFDEVEYGEIEFQIPNTWVAVRFGALVKLINGDRGKNYPNRNEYVETGLPFINTGHIEPNGSLSTERMNYITREKFNNLGGGKIIPGDLVYCLRGATMGKTAKVDNYAEGAIASSLVIVRPNRQLLTSFAYQFLISPQGKDLITRFDNGSAQPNLSAKSVSIYPFALPTIEEQTEIVRRVEELFAFADNVEAQVNAAQLRVNNLTQSILAKAFRGELTADWRAANPELISGDNSAEALLKKIKAEREAIKKQPKPERSAVKKKTGSSMSKQMIKVVEALKEAGKPLSGQQLLAAAGYPSDSNTEQLEQFFLDIRDALTVDKSIVKVKRGDDGQDWFTSADVATHE